jgi:hypothetical protein
MLFDHDMPARRSRRRLEMSARTHIRFRPALALFVALFWTACSDRPSGVAPDTFDESVESVVTQQLIERHLPAALGQQVRITPGLLRTPGIVGSAVALGADGLPTVVALVEHPGVSVPKGVGKLVTGLLSALAWQQVPPVADPQAKPTCGKRNLPPCDDPPPNPDPEPGRTERHPRPVPIGISTGHPAITAGTIGARVTDGTNVWALSNNHVYADVNAASLGDAVIQPGSYDGGTSPADDIGTLADYEPLDFSACTNVMDAAIALSSTDDLGNGTPSAGYGTPRISTMAATLNVKVKKFGRTTGQTKGSINGVNATLNVGYGSAGVACFTGQLVITPGAFSSGGDSGSLVVVDGKGRSRADSGRPVGLLFAGSSQSTIISPIDPILARFGVTIDGN